MASGPFDPPAVLPTLALDEPGPAPDMTGTIPVETLVSEGRYEDRGRLGIGGNGEVRRVFDTKLQRMVAMKLLKHVPGDTITDRGLFLEEAQASASLQHPNIVPLYEYGVTADGRPWFTMREVEGQTLTEIIVRVHEVSADTWGVAEGGWTLRRMIAALLSICQAVEYAHRRGVVHRDLKPDNVMVGGLGELYVLDWGLARPLTSAEAEPGGASVVGTPAFMAPEQARGELDHIDERTDVYALGAILYTMLDGSLPYPGFSGSEVVAAVVHSAPPPLGRGGPPVPPALLAVCDRAMARDPDQRFPRARDMAAAIEEWLDEAKRRDQAREVVVRALALTDRVEQLTETARALRAEAAGLLDGVAPWQPAADKAPGWQRIEQADACDREARLVDLQIDQGLYAALRVFDALPEAHAALAARFRARHAEAEAARDTDAMARAEVPLTTHLHALPRNHPVRLDGEAYLRGDGAISLVSDPPGALVFLHRYGVENRRQVERLERSLGTTPIVEQAVPMGSYVLVLRSPGRAEVRYPIEVPRQGHWDGVPPGATEPHPIWLPPDDFLGDDEVYVPAGWYRSGGDDEAFRSTPERRIWCDGFVMQRFPITNAEYIAFLDDLVAQGREDEALQHAPRERSSSEGVLGGMLYGRTAAGGFALQADGDGDIWSADWPVFHLDWHGAQAYMDWYAQRSGRAWRLPGELEWEKAARGVDGRWFPWGNELDPSFACMSDSHQDRPLPSSVRSYPTDVSPYGVRGLGGNVRDWCADHEGVVTDDAVAVPARGIATADTRRTVRGGSWFDGKRGCRSANRDQNVTGFRVPLNGFRGLWRLDTSPPE